MSKYLSSSHSTFNVGYHIVFCPKYRYNLLRYRAEKRLRQLLDTKASFLGVDIQVMEIMPDHVHVFLTTKPSVKISNVIRQLKGYTSYFMRQEFAYLRRYPSLWTRSYFVETIGHISEKTVVNYIETQKSKSPFISQLKQGGFPG